LVLLGTAAGHSTWTCCTRDATVYGPPLSRDWADCLATWLEQIAITYYCPRLSDQIGII